MGVLTEAAFEPMVRACPACGAASLELRAYLDRHVAVMLGDPDDDGRWAHDGEKFIDGVYRVTCTACGHVALDAPDCPRCHAPGALAAALATPTRTMPPKRCPTCKATELVVVGFAPGVVVTGGGRPPPPRPLAALGEPGFHVDTIDCDTCGPIGSAPGCPICAGPGPLRERP